MTSITLVAPCFEPTFFGRDHQLALFGKKANMPVAALPTLAALTPPEYDVTLVDEAVEELDFDRIAEADIVGLTGMIVQRSRMLEIAREIKARGAFLVIGGPWVTAQEDYFDGLADVIFVGEADTTWPRFLEDWRSGTHESRYQQAERTDMTTLPPQRFDLLDMSAYGGVGIQVSRGCPFRCEFCVIIVMFGRVPRVKNPDQVIAEMDAARAQGVRAIFIVDDNFIGNKKLVRPVLEAIIAWQREHSYPVLLSTEASINLAEEEELLDLMIEANFVGVFVGVESPNEDVLKETRKVQNLKRGRNDAGPSLADDIVRRLNVIQRKGLAVQCGMIVGFDNDHPDVFDKQKDFISRSGVSAVVVGMLTAIPTTPLHERLASEGRLDTKDPPDFGTNVVPRNMTRQQLQDGYVRLMNELYEPEAFFARWEAEFALRVPQIERSFRRRCPNPVRRAMMFLTRAVIAGVVYARLKRRASNRALMQVYRQQTLKRSARNLNRWDSQRR